MNCGADFSNHNIDALLPREIAEKAEAFGARTTTDKILAADLAGRPHQPDSGNDRQYHRRRRTSRRHLLVYLPAQPRAAVGCLM